VFYFERASYDVLDRRAAVARIRVEWCGRSARAPHLRQLLPAPDSARYDTLRQLQLAHSKAEKSRMRRTTSEM